MGFSLGAAIVARRSQDMAGRGQRAGHGGRYLILSYIQINAGYPPSLLSPSIPFPPSLPFSPFPNSGIRLGSGPCQGLGHRLDAAGLRSSEWGSGSFPLEKF